MRDTKEWIMTKRRFFGAVVAGLALAAVLAGCRGDGMPSALVGSWGLGSIEVFEINANGSGTIAESAVTWSATGSRLSLVDERGHDTGSVAWSIQGDRLHFSDPEGERNVMLVALMAMTGDSGFERLVGGGDTYEPSPIAPEEVELDTYELENGDEGDLVGIEIEPSEVDGLDAEPDVPESVQ